MPDNASAAAIAMAFAASGSLGNCQTTALMTAEGMDAMRKAATCGYKLVAPALPQLAVDSRTSRAFSFAQFQTWPLDKNLPS
jgi:hypothetical protein